MKGHCAVVYLVVPSFITLMFLMCCPFDSTAKWCCSFFCEGPLLGFTWFSMLQSTCRFFPWSYLVFTEFCREIMTARYLALPRTKNPSQRPNWIQSTEIDGIELDLLGYFVLYFLFSFGAFRWERGSSSAALLCWCRRGRAGGWRHFRRGGAAEAWSALPSFAEIR